MADARRLTFTVPVLSVLALLPTLLTPARGDAIEVLRQESRAYHYHTPSAADLAKAEELFGMLLAGEARLDRSIALCRELSLELILVNQRGEDFLVLAEVGDDAQGRGFYAFRRRRFRPVAIQAPHSYHDRHTGELASSFFAESRAVAAAWNTVGRTHDEVGEGTADLAHAERSFYLAFTRAFARVHPRGVVVQIHGFSKKKRTTPEGTLSGAIVSGGTADPAPWVLILVACLDEQLEALVSVYPRDVSELGGTRNTQGILLRSLGHTGFLHVELSAGVRRTLVADAGARRRFWLCLRSLPR